MPLPKLNVPVYEAILPSTESVIKYRPFLVKEEKILMTAMEAKDNATMQTAVKQIITNCVQEKIDVENLPTFDLEYLFLRLRAKSVGEKVTIGLSPFPCSQNNGELCEKSTEVEVNLEEVKVVKDKTHTNKLMLDDKIGVMMEYPNADAMQSATGKDTFETGMNLIKSGIKMIFTEEELEEFIESLNSDQFQKIRSFYDTMPVLKHTVKYKCSTCGEEKETTIQGLDSFFGSA